MANTADSVPKTNEDANEAFDGKDPKAKLDKAKTVTKVNEAADQEFNGDEKPLNVGNRVGGIRGSSD